MGTVVNDANAVILLLEALHYRQDLEEVLIKCLTDLGNNPIPNGGLKKLVRKPLSGSLQKNIENALAETKVTYFSNGKMFVNQTALISLIEKLGLAKVCRDYSWTIKTPTPILYVSPPSLITESIAKRVDDISNLLINLVASTQDSLLIMSPFMNIAGLKAVLSPLCQCKSSPTVALFLVANSNEKSNIYRNVCELLPEHLQSGFRLFFCTKEHFDKQDLPHAKFLVVDDLVGYMGSANITSFGLRSHFELGIRLSADQCHAVANLVDVLVVRGIYERHAV